MSFDDEIQNDWIGVRFFCTIDGIPHVFMDGPALKGQYRNDWDPPQTKAGSWSDADARNYAIQEYALDLGSGLKDIGQKILRREGHTSPGSMTLRLMDDRQDTLLNLFARDKNDGNTALLDADLAYDLDGSGSVIECDDLTGWGASGYAWLGRECMYYVRYGDDLGSSGGYKVIRDVFSVGSSDLSYTANVNSTAAPRVISDYPRVWHNRCVRVFAVLVDRDGYTLSEAGSDWFTDTYTREIFRGVLQGNPEPDEGLGSWALRVRSIDALLHSNVGREPVEATLIQQPGNWKANEEAKGINPQGAPGAYESGIYITESTQYVDLQLHDHLSTGIDKSFHFEIASPGTFLTMSQLRARFAALSDEVNDFEIDWDVTGNDPVVLTTIKPFETVTIALTTTPTDAGFTGYRVTVTAGTWPPEWAGAGGYYFNQNCAEQIWLNPYNAGTAIKLIDDNVLLVLISSHPDVDEYSGHRFKCTWHWQQPDSVGKLLGFNQMMGGETTFSNNTPDIDDAGANGGVVVFAGPDDTTAFAHIAASDQTIPFFQTSTQGQSTETPQSAGFCIIDDEVIRYSSITDASGTLEGLYLLNNCERGLAGTQAKTHRVALEADGTPAQDAVTIRFVTMFYGVSLFDAILQLATSTGGGHHGDYDTLGAYTGPAIPPEHFDISGIKSVQNMAGLSEWEHVLYYWFDKPQKLMDLISKWLKPLNMFVTARTGAGGEYQITIEQVLPPLESQAFHTLTASTISVDNFGSWQTGADQIVNELSVKWLFDMAEGSVKDNVIVARDLDSIADYGTKGRIEWELQGYRWAYSTAIKRVYHWARRLFRSYGRPYDLLELQTDRQGWSIKPGQCVVITTPAIPSTEGGRGFNYRAAMVLGVAHTYHNPNGEPGTKLTVALEHVERQSTYVPSARVAAYNAGTKTLTLAANSYTEPGNATDAEHFEVGDRIYVFNEGTAETTDANVISSISGNNVVITPGLSAVTFSASTTVITSQEHDASLEDNQRLHVYISTLTGGFSQTPFHYV